MIAIHDAVDSASHSSVAEQHREAYFNGSAILKLASTVSVHRHSGLSFRTCDGGRLFTQKFNNDRISLEVNPEGLLLVAHVDNQRYDATLSARLLNNAWHTVNLLFRLGNLTLNAAGHTQVFNYFEKSFLTNLASFLIYFANKLFRSIQKNSDEFEYLSIILNSSGRRQCNL